MKTSTAIREREKEYGQPEIIPWPLSSNDDREATKARKICVDQKFIYYKDHQIPIAQFKKSGYDKLLKLIVKEIEG